MQLILFKFLSNFKVSVIWEYRTTQASDSIWCSLYKSFIRIFLVQLTQSLSVQHIFSEIYSLRGSIQLIKNFDEDSMREYLKWVSEIKLLLIQVVCVCVVKGSYEG